MNHREQGFYWILLRDKPGKWIAAEWADHLFIVPGSSFPVQEADVYRIHKDRLQAPDAMLPLPFLAVPPREHAGIAVALDKLKKVLEAA